LLFHVGKFEETGFKVPPGYTEHARGYERATLMDRSLGSVHMGAGICRLQPKGSIDRCIHAYEKGLYILDGELELRRGDEAFRLSTDDYVLVPCGVPHEIRNSGSKAARWFEMAAPQPKLLGGWQDTYFGATVDWPAAVHSPDFESPTTKSVGHFKPQNPLFRDGAERRGLSVYRFMHREFGAQNFFMMRGELAVGGVRTYHDHPLEELYFALSGETFMDIEGRRFHLRPGDIAWTGVGTSHAFSQAGDQPFRWIETQAPQFPAQNGTRNYSDWEKLKDGF
jgi:mannose-6-phosphate isomerase-like protein (cupin superfamily)